ncbi:MAG: hypothetical protein AB202_04055 [Parcubacteria bacterium C7867-007]|nr:MAG: hypothetical protein AB202_04055 [Parcubacteria bacterium C7867-007]
MKSLDEKIEGLTEQVASTNERLDRFSKSTDKRFESVDMHFNELSESIDKRFTETNTAIDDLARATAGGFNDLHNHMHEVRDEIAGIKVILVSLERFMLPLRSDHDVLTGRVKKLEEHVFV